MIRVLNIMGSLACGGAETTVMNYYRNIDRSKVQFDFLITDYGENYYESEAISLGARVFKRPMRTKDPFGNMKGLVRVLKNNPEIQIIHVHNKHPVIAIDILLAAFCRIPVRIAHSRNAVPNFPFTQRIFQPLLRATATHWLSCSTEAATSLFGLKQVANSKIVIFKNARYLERFRYDVERRGSVRKELDIDKQIVLLNVGNLKTQKNQKFLIEAFALARKKQPDLFLLIAGDGNLRTELEEKAMELGLRESVRLLGHRDDISDLMQAADWFVLPSLYEGLPGAAIEAQTAGLPCLISDAVTPECRITDLVEFLPIDKGPECWADKMAEVRDLERRDPLEDIRRAGYDITEAAERLETLYLNALKEKCKRLKRRRYTRKGGNKLDTGS